MTGTMTTEPGEPAWRPIALFGLPPGHVAHQLDTAGNGPAIRITGLSGDSVTGQGATKAEAISNARAKLKMIGGIIA